MPLVDMPLEKLLEYRGTNPKPADHEKFWDKSILEMNQFDVCPTLIPKEMNADFAECFELRFNGTRGGEVYAKYIRPKGAKNVPCILQFHGYSMHSGDWMHKLNWVARGFAVAAMDCRGQGGESRDGSAYEGMTLKGHIVRGLDGPPEEMYFRNVYLDTALLAKVVSSFDEIDGSRLGAMGSSQGGALTIACAALAPIKKAASVYPFLCDYQRVWEMDLAKDAYDELRYYFRMRDPRHERESEVFGKLGYIDLQHLAHRIKGEIKLFGGLMDTITPPSTYFAAYNKMTCQKSHVLYPDFGHEGLPGADDLIWEFFSDL